MRRKRFEPLLRCKHEEEPEKYLRRTAIIEDGESVLECIKCYDLITPSQLQEAGLAARRSLGEGGDEPDNDDNHANWRVA